MPLLTELMISKNAKLQICRAYGAFAVASVKNFVEKKPPRPRRCPGATGARIVPNPQRVTIPRCDGTSSCRHASNPCCELGQLAFRFRRAARKRQSSTAFPRCGEAMKQFIWRRKSPKGRRNRTDSRRKPPNTRRRPKIVVANRRQGVAGRRHPVATGRKAVAGRRTPVASQKSPSQAGKQASQGELPDVLVGYSPHRSKNGRTDGFSSARTESWLARNGQLPARIEFSPHGRENGRTKRFIAARRGKLPAQIGFEAAGSDFCSHRRISHRLRLIPRCAGHSRAPFLPPCSPDLNPIEHLWRKTSLPPATSSFLSPICAWVIVNCYRCGRILFCRRRCCS